MFLKNPALSNWKKFSKKLRQLWKKIHHFLLKTLFYFDSSINILFKKYNKQTYLILKLNSANFPNFFKGKNGLDLKIDLFLFCWHFQSAICRKAGKGPKQCKLINSSEIHRKIPKSKRKERKERSGDVNKSVSLIFVHKRNTFLCCPPSP